MLGYPAAGEQIADQALVQAAGRLQIQVLEAGRLPDQEVGFSQLSFSSRSKLQPIIRLR